MIQKKGLSDFSKTEKRVCDTLHFHKPFFLQCSSGVNLSHTPLELGQTHYLLIIYLFVVLFFK